MLGLSESPLDSRETYVKEPGVVASAIETPFSIRPTTPLTGSTLPARRISHIPTTQTTTICCLKATFHPTPSKRRKSNRRFLHFPPNHPRQKLTNSHFCAKNRILKGRQDSIFLERGRLVRSNVPEQIKHSTFNKASPSHLSPHWPAGAAGPRILRILRFNSFPIRSTNLSRSRTSLAALGNTCSHTRTTCQPALRNLRDTSRSRSRFRASFSCQNDLLDDGFVPCHGHPCQKHPSTNNATRSFRQTKSGRTRKGFVKRLNRRAVKSPDRPSPPFNLLTDFRFNDSTALPFNDLTNLPFNQTTTCLLHPLIPAALSSNTIAPSVSLFPRDRIRDITSLRFAFVKMSAIPIKIPAAPTSGQPIHGRARVQWLPVQPASPCISSLLSNSPPSSIPPAAQTPPASTTPADHKSLSTAHPSNTVHHLPILRSPPVAMPP